MLDLEPRNCFCGSLYQIEKNNSKIVSLEKIENVSNLLGSSREDREYREVALIAVCSNGPGSKWAATVATDCPGRMAEHSKYK